MVHLHLVFSILCGVIVRALPLVDPGLFVISGVSTCGNGSGYCLLGSDCRMNQDFQPDNKGHCLGLKGAFTPSAHFICCTSPQSHNEVHHEQQGEVVETPTTPSDCNTTSESTGHQTITSPPDYIQDTEFNENESDNSVEWDVGRNQSESLDTCPACSPQMVFTLEGKTICVGTHLRHGWVLTSGSCALRIFRAGMIKVAGKFLEDPKLQSNVRTIAVHEDYRPYSTNILHPESNNLGLVLMSSEPKAACSPCIPDKEDKFAGSLCSTTANSTALAMRITKRDNSIVDDMCESSVETMQGEGKEDFYTVACESGTLSRYGDESVENGRGLLCRGYIAGIETTSGTGVAVFTRVAAYSDWITTNMMQEQRQSFDTSSTS